MQWLHRLRRVPCLLQGRVARHDEGHGHLVLQRVGHADHGHLGDCRVAGDAPIDEAAHLSGGAGRRGGFDHHGLQRRRFGRGSRSQVAAGGSVHLSHRLRSARRPEGVDGAGRDAKGQRLHAIAVRRHRRVQLACGRALRGRRPPGAGTTLPLHNPARPGQRSRADQRRRPGGAQARDPLARRHHAPGHVAAGVHAAAGGAGAKATPTPHPLPRRAGTLIYNSSTTSRARCASITRRPWAR